MKKIFMMLAAVAAFSFVSCGGGDTTDAVDSDSIKAAVEAAAAAVEEVATEAEEVVTEGEEAVEDAAEAVQEAVEEEANA